MSLRSVADELVSLCRQGQFETAIRKLYSPNIVSVEACESPADPKMPREMKGIDAILGKTKWWVDNHIMHKSDVQGPFLHGDDRFAVVFDFDVTFKPANRRMAMVEVAVYTVAGDKVVHEDFYYTM